MNSRTQIVATIGPSSNTKEIIKEMAEKGMDVARLNFSWGTHQEMSDFVRMIREVGSELEKRIPIIQDLSGPREQNVEGFGHHFDKDACDVITEKDKQDLEWAESNEPEYVALSYVGSGKDVSGLRDVLKEKNIKAKIIAKIERQRAVENIDEILKEADAVMVARGDLGNEVPLEQIPFIQKDLIEKANQAGKPVIVATEMMSSMMEKDIPTRSDVTDVANAVLTNADAIMLSNETATGDNPTDVVLMMEKIAVEAERHGEERDTNVL